MGWMYKKGRGVPHILFRQSDVIETINDQLKNISQIEHSRHRSLHGFMLNLLGGLIAYSHKEDKPALNINAGDPTSLMLI